MAMTIVVTRNSPDRIRGFLASCMCEITPGVYTGVRLTEGVRDRIWSVLEAWYIPASEHAILMTWPDSTVAGGQAFRFLGAPRQDLWDYHGVYLARQEIDAETIAKLKRASGSDVGAPPESA